ncbi:hypothetical protein [Komagataeibacter xylinus]|uniref:hypothetical protein n=1 Tax=Komagataeibacter xylinus TaxID=28448 RepID=UPI0013EE294E|nr:hypothetical protein [Komagataeibacter xylinus]
MSLTPEDFLPIVDKVRRLPDGKLRLAIRVLLQGQDEESWPAIKITLLPGDFNARQGLAELAMLALQKVEKAAGQAVIAFRQSRW